MKLVHNIEMRIFCKDGDDETKIKEKIHELFPFDFKKERIILKETIAKGFDKKIKILAVIISKSQHIKAFLRNLMSKLSREQKDMLLKQIDSRLDDNMHFYIRLDKDMLLDGKYYITDSGNCFHFNIALAAYPRKREVAKEIVREIIKIQS